MKHESLRTNAGACRRSLAVAASICLLHAGAGLSAPAFKGPDLAELPEPAQKAIKEQAGDGKLVRIEETIKDDQPCYRVELKKDGKDRSFTVDDEGKLCRLQVFLEETPALVQTGLREQLGDGTLAQIEKVMGDDGTLYQVEMTRGGRERDFAVTTNGALAWQEVFWGETPAPVQKTIRVHSRAGRLGEIHRVGGNGQTVFQVEMTRHRKPMPFSVSADGKLISAVVSLEETPPPVQNTIKRQVGDGYLDTVELSIDEGEKTYDVTFTKGDQTKDFTVLANGKLERP